MGCSVIFWQQCYDFAWLERHWNEIAWVFMLFNETKMSFRLIFVIDCIGNYPFDSFRCSWWQWFRQNDVIFISLLVCISVRHLPDIMMLGGCMRYFIAAVNQYRMPSHNITCQWPTNRICFRHVRMPRCLYDNIEIYKVRYALMMVHKESNSWELQELFIANHDLSCQSILE